MVSVTFTGDPRGGDNPASCAMHGLVFPLGEPVQVTPAIAAKLAGNSHFRVEEAGPEPLAPAADESIPPPRRRGRPPKALQEQPQ